MARKRKRFGMHHDSRRISYMAPLTQGKAMPVRVKIGRASTGHYTAFACVKYRGRSVKASHCGELSGGTTPTKAAARALASLAKSLSRAR